MREVVYGASVGLQTDRLTDIIDSLKKGLPYSSFITLQEEVGVSAKVLAETVNIATRTLHRRKREGKFHTDESERLFRIGRLFDKAKEILGQEEAQRWFATPKRALGGKTPLEFADTEPGAQEVADLLGRLDHGVFP